jgi:hypothetical protein
MRPKTVLCDLRGTFAIFAVALLTAEIAKQFHQARKEKLYGQRRGSRWQ